MRLAVYTDQKYWRSGEAVYAERAFIGFVGGLADHVDALTVAGRLVPGDGRSHYRLAGSVQFVALPHYASAADPVAVLRALGGSIRRFWALLSGVDAVWLLGPSPFAIVFALLGAVRRRTVVLGVRQHYPEYARRRHPGQRVVAALADAQEATFRVLARRFAVVTVGEDLARGYRHAAAVLPIAISLVPDRYVASEDDALARDYAGPELRALSVGRLDAEKNPLLLAEVIARLDERWRLVVCGEGPLAGELEQRLVELSVRDRVELRGHVGLDDGLRELYRSSHALLHVSWTEGLPQVLVEAFAAGLPTVATDVGGVAGASGDAAVLVPPGDAGPPARALAQIAGDAELRGRLMRAALTRARTQTLEVTTAAVARFIADQRRRATSS